MKKTISIALVLISIASLSIGSAFAFSPFYEEIMEEEYTGHCKVTKDNIKAWIVADAMNQSLIQTGSDSVNWEILREVANENGYNIKTQSETERIFEEEVERIWIAQY